MSSLRIDTLRLCWLETFVAVAESENMSEAARVLGISQPSVTRHLQALEQWTGKTLVITGKVHDPDNAGVSVGITDAGNELFELAGAVVAVLTDFRSKEARYQEMVDDIQDLIRKLELDLRSKRNDVITSIRSNVEMFRKTFDNFDPELSLDFVETYRRNIRLFFTEYEERCKQGKKRKKGKATKVEVEEGFWETFSGGLAPADQD